MKQPIKQYIAEPQKRVLKVWYPYRDDEDESNSLVFKEYSGKEEDENLCSKDSLTISQVMNCVNAIVEKYKIHPDAIWIKSIVLDGDGEDTTIEFGFYVKLSDQEYAEKMAEYNRKQNEQKQKFAEWEAFNKAKKIQDLKRELEKLQEI